MVLITLMNLGELQILKNWKMWGFMCTYEIKLNSIPRCMHMVPYSSWAICMQTKVYNFSFATYSIINIMICYRLVAKIFCTETLSFETNSLPNWPIFFCLRRDRSSTELNRVNLGLIVNQLTETVIRKRWLKN